MMVSHASNQNIPAEDDHHPGETDHIKNSNDANVVMSNSSSAKKASTSTLVIEVEAEERLFTPPKDEVIYDVFKHMRKVHVIVNMFDALSMFPTCRKSI